MKKLSVALFALLFSLPLAAHAKVNVVSTIPDFGAIAREIGGDRIEVTSLVRPTQDPHFLDAKPSFIVALNKADLVMLTGMELEAGWLPPLLQGARNAKVQRGGTGYLDCSTLIAPKEVEAPDRAKGDIHPGGNPHYWTDPRNALYLARGIATRLSAIDPDGTSDYAAGLTRFAKKMGGKMAEWKSKLAPLKGMKVIVYHRSWIYFLDWAGLVEAGALEPKPGIPPSPDYIAQLLQKVKDQKISFVIQESYYPTNLSKNFAQQSGAKLLILPSMVGAKGTTSYTDEIDAIVRALTGAEG